jgi:CO dehydrogenase/acetyl-CoA synthase beta subunit
MPFRSEEQRRFLHWKHPEIAKRWEKDYENEEEDDKEEEEDTFDKTVERILQSNDDV